MIIYNNTAANNCLISLCGNTSRTISDVHEHIAKSLTVFLLDLKTISDIHTIASIWNSPLL